MPNRAQSDNYLAGHADAAPERPVFDDADWGAAQYDDASRYSRDRYGSGSAASPDRRASDYLGGPGDDRASFTSAADSAYSYDDVTSNDSYRQVARSRKRKRRVKRVVATVFGLLAVVLVAGGAYAAWFVSSLDTALAPVQEVKSDLERILVPETPGKPYYVLVMGSDSREGNYSGHIDQRGDNERSDVMMLVQVDQKHDKITMLSIPRDTPYQVEDGSYVKINEMYNAYGEIGSIKAVMDITGLPISHFANVRISGLEGIVDALGGVTVDVPTELSYVTTDQETVTIEPGRQTLNGREAQIFARARHEFEGNQDEHRQSNVRQLLSAIIDKILDRPVSDLPRVVLELAEYVDTDYNTVSAISLAMNFGGGDLNIVSATGPSNGDINEATGGKWLCFLNPEGWQKTVEALQAGEDPSGIDYAATEIPWSEVTDQPEFETSAAHRYYYGPNISKEEWLESIGL